MAEAGAAAELLVAEVGEVVQALVEAAGVVAELLVAVAAEEDIQQKPTKKSRG